MNNIYEQNPYRCGDSGCVLHVPGALIGQVTNSGCKCLADTSPETRVRVREGIYWLRERVSLFYECKKDSLD